MQHIRGTTGRAEQVLMAHADLAFAGAASPDPNAKGANKEPEYEPMQILIEYEIRNPKDGIQVVKPSELYPHVRCSI